jgi:type II secretory pathway component PulF
VPPLVIVGAAGLWWLWAGSADSLEPLSRAFFWLPAVGRMMHCARTASFTEILALLLENQVPLDQAVVLAADAWGDPALTRSAARFAQLIAQGANVSQDDPQTAAIPPLVRWLLLTSPPRTLVPMLRYTAETFHRRALRYADWLRLTFPIVATLIIAGGVTFAYALTLFIPFAELIQKLTAPFKL